MFITKILLSLEESTTFVTVKQIHMATFNDNRKLEIINIPLANLLLDNNNPRLAGENLKNDQNEILSKMYYEDLDELAGSLAVHGFLPEEPIIVVPEDSRDFDAVNKDNVADYNYIVIEGNRRVSSIKLLLDESLRTMLDIDEDFPKISSPEIKDNLQTIPAIVYRERKNVDAYLGIRHITGNRKWDAYAKARYIYDKVEQCRHNDGMTTSQAIDTIKKQIADRKDTILKLYVYYCIFNIIDQEIVNYQSKHIKDRFSLLQLALGMGRTSIAQYIGVPPFSEIDFSKDIIDTAHIEQLTDITKWIFGLNEYDQNRVISDSRNIGRLLAPVLSNKESTEYLKRYGDLAGAYELTGGEEELVRKSLNKAYKALGVVKDKVFKYRKSEEVKQALDDIEGQLKQIKILINGK